MDSTWTVTSNDGSHVAAYELGGSGEVLLIAHATGLCGAMYQLLADQLTHRFRVVALDFRGHGSSSRSPDIDYRWSRMAEDVTAVTEHIGAGPVCGFGHSMGGAALLLAEKMAPSTFRSLFLFEPIIFPDDFAKLGQNVMADAARRRRAVFDSRADVLYRYASRPPFNRILAGFLASYVDNGFADHPDGGVRLRCLPDVEAEVFENGQASDLSAIHDLETPIAVAVGREEPGPDPARLGPPLVAALARGQLIRYDHIGHFGPLQDPWSVARDIVQHADGLL